MEAPYLPVIRWSNQASQFLEDLLDENIAYVDIDMAVEHLLRYGEHERISETINIEGIDISTYQIPSYLGLPAILVHFIERRGGVIDVLRVSFLQ